MPTTGNYEFTTWQNSQIEKAASRTRLWGIVSLIGGILGVIFTILFVVGLAAANLMSSLGAAGATAVALVFGFLGPLALVYAVVGKLYIDSGNALKAVVTSQGNDVQHLMSALDKMANAFRLEVIMTIIGFAVGLVVGVLSGTGVIPGGS